MPDDTTAPVGAFTIIGCSVPGCDHRETRVTYLEATTAMDAHHSTKHPDIAQPSLPKAAVELIRCAADHGWRIGVGHGLDSGDSPFINIELGINDPSWLYRLTWHTRGTGTYRLFTKICRGGGHWWRDAPSVEAIGAHIASTEVVAT
jgi:hypothetical protein